MLAALERAEHRRARAALLLLAGAVLGVAVTLLAGLLLWKHAAVGFLRWDLQRVTQNLPIAAPLTESVNSEFDRVATHFLAGDLTLSLTVRAQQVLLNSPMVQFGVQLTFERWGEAVTADVDLRQRTARLALRVAHAVDVGAISHEELAESLGPLGRDQVGEYGLFFFGRTTHLVEPGNVDDAALGAMLDRFGLLLDTRGVPETLFVDDFDAAVRQRVDREISWML